MRSNLAIVSRDWNSSMLAVAIWRSKFSSNAVRINCCNVSSLSNSHQGRFAMDSEVEAAIRQDSAGGVSGRL